MSAAEALRQAIRRLDEPRALIESRPRTMWLSGVRHESTVWVLEAVSRFEHARPIPLGQGGTPGEALANALRLRREAPAWMTRKGGAR